MELSLPRSIREFYLNLDPRIPVAFVLLVYLALGLTVLDIRRTPAQALTTTVSCLALELGCCWLFYRRLIFPLSMFITSLSLSFLLSFENSFFLLFLPVFYSVAMKYLLTFDGRHFFNPAGTAVSLSVMTSQKLITIAPASQWNTLTIMPAVVVACGLLFVIPKVRRTWLVASYLLFFLIFALIRAQLDSEMISGDVLVWGTLSSASFLIFTFFMITDPATSPKGSKEQVVYGFFLALIDFLLHLRQNYYTFFLSLFVLTWIRFLYLHLSAAAGEGVGSYLRKRFWGPRYYWRPLFFGTLLFVGSYDFKSYSGSNAQAMVTVWKLVRFP
jgi:Na+-translocating ferredoxin:NAD+ oxidoreductase RnfD subunit